MKTFAVSLEGTGIELPLEDGSDPAIGFFATRWVKALSLQDAQDLAKAEILAEWIEHGRYGSSNRGNPPQLLVDSAWAVSFLKVLFRRKPAGYTFYTFL